MMDLGSTLVLTQSDVRSLIDMADAVAAVEAGFAAHGRGDAQMPVKVFIDLPDYFGDFRAMPAYMDGSVGVKWVNMHARNPEIHGLPAVLGMYILSDPSTALPLALMDATLLTAFRTGAAAGVGARHLARQDAATLGIIGCGVQAPMIIAAVQVAVGDLEMVASDASAAAAEAFVAEHGGRLGTAREAAGCDIVCTATPVREPIVRRDWIRPGTHINAIGADTHGKQELEGRLLVDAKVVVDDLEQASGGGEINVPLNEGVLQHADVHGTLGEVVAGLKPGREDDEEITVFDSTGLAVQDLALARVIYERAREGGAGRKVAFFD